MDELLSDRFALSDNEFVERDVRQSRRVYLLTYSQADLVKFPTRLSFAEAVLNAFEKTGAPLSHWACCQEQHSNSGTHYYLTASVSKMRRWKTVKKFLQESYGISVHFSSKSLGYVAAYRYICKSDKSVLHSEGHPDLKQIGSPRTKKCMTVNSTKAMKRKSSEATSMLHTSSVKRPQASKPKRLTMTHVAEYILLNNIKSHTQLQSIAFKRRQEGENDLFSFLAQNSSKKVEELIERVWDMHKAPQREAVEIVTRMEKLNRLAEKECSAECNGQWFKCATEVLQWNNINKFVFSAAIRELLKKGRKKRLNIFLIGPSNCGKSFLLEPLEVFFFFFFFFFI